MPSEIRLKKISDRIYQDMSEMLVMEISDPRLSGVTVTDVKVDREFAYANIYVSAVEGHERAEEILEGLERAKGFIRSRLASKIQLRVFPRLRFHWDSTPEQADHIEKLFKAIRDQEANSVEDNE